MAGGGRRGHHRGKSGGGGGLDGIWLNASLELDIWGRLRYGRAAAEQQAAAFVADYAYARQSLAATVAKSWFLAIEAGLQRAIAQDAVRSTDALLRVAQDRLRVGNGNEQAVAEARASAGTYRDRLREIELAREQALRALELLVGRYPGAEIAVADRLSSMPPPAPVGMPSQLLERRPDVIAAERRVAAAFDRVGEARAAMLPRISLTAGGSSVSSDLIVLQGHEQPHLELRRQPGRAAVPGRRAARAGRDPVGRAEAGGRGVRAGGPAGVRRSRKRARRRERAARPLRDSRGHDPRQRARAASSRKSSIASATVDLRAVEQNQLALYSARIALLRVQTERLAQRVNLHLALGGGFDLRLPAMEPVAAR